MEREGRRQRRARIFGGVLIGSVAAIAIGTTLREGDDPSLASQVNADDRPAHRNPDPPPLKAIPREQYPLSLANDPAAEATDVVNAHFKSWNGDGAESVPAPIPQNGDSAYRRE